MGEDTNPLADSIVRRQDEQITDHLYLVVLIHNECLLHQAMGLENSPVPARQTPEASTKNFRAWLCRSAEAAIGPGFQVQSDFVDLPVWHRLTFHQAAAMIQKWTVHAWAAEIENLPVSLGKFISVMLGTGAAGQDIHTSYPFQGSLE